MAKHQSQKEAGLPLGQSSGQEWVKVSDTIHTCISCTLDEVMLCLTFCLWVYLCITIIISGE